MGATYLKELQDIVRKYRAETQIGLVTSREIAVWAIKNKLWSMGEAQIINRCADDLAKAMREEYIIDPQGRKVRAKHAAKVPVNERQQTLWDDIRTADRKFMAIALQQRRRQIVGDCRQLKADVDSYNQNYNPGDPIQMIFDFRLDVLETDAAAAA
ncbi:MAG TPA: hypothetical protein VN494_03695 [Patescibacteria group bacterium]|nr:hypothetical protein [Patescibacteria group bacterium]